MNVLSLFDGMSCGRIALERLGIKVDNYYSSEIDKYAIQVSEANYPDIIQIGDVTKINYEELPQIDLIMGGSPCQGFSFAGKQLAFDDPRSALFFCFWRAVKHLKPKYFLLENVRMKKEYLDVISEYMGVEPIMINSALVSAQNRVRYYWTNIPGIEQPEQRGIVLRDILEDGFNSDRDKSYCIDANYSKTGAKPHHYKDKYRRQLVYQEETHDKPKKIHDIPRDILKDNERQRRVYAQEGKSPSLLARSDSPKIMKETHDTPKQVGTAVDIKGHDQIKRVYSEDGKSSTLTTCGGGHREPKVAVFSEDRINKFKETLKDDPKPSANGIIQLNNPSHSSGRVYSPKGKSPTLMAGNSGGGKEPVKINHDLTWRKLTPLECERLQTVPDNYTNHVSNTQRYKMLGNGWTIEVIAHILKNMEIK
jgi:DNA (cytosine-5)-methyltransferase 3A